MNKEIEIPEGYEARIEGNKVILEPKESEDEKRMKAIAVLKQQRYYWSYDGPSDKTPPATTRKELVEAIDVALPYLEKQKEQKPAGWSAEDEENFKWFDKFFRAESIVLNGRDIPQDKYLWFKSLHPQSKAELSEKDKKIIGRLRSVVNECAFRNDALDVNGDYCEGDYGELDNWLKALPERFNLQSKQEWSKEEKGILLECVTALQNSSHWLLADKLSSLSPQPHWKPSEEQMEALARATNRCVGVDDAKILIKLLEQLEKL